MNKYWIICCLGLLVSFSSVTFADSDETTDAVTAAEQGCLQAAQERYGVPADGVSRRDSVTKWNSGLKGYKVELSVTQEDGKADDYSCVARKDGSYKFFAD